MPATDTGLAGRQVMFGESAGCRGKLSTSAQLQLVSSLDC
jgi:hypothetical protein